MSPPMTVACATPCVESSRGRIVQSASVRSSSSDVVSDVSDTIIISPSMDDCGPSVGRPTVSGKASDSVDNFSETICRALYMSVPQSNSTHTTENPVVDDERTRRTSVAPLRAVSSGKVTIFSTSSGASPAASVRTVTVGAFRSGKTSTSMFLVVYAPAITSNTAAAMTNMRLRRL